MHERVVLPRLMLTTIWKQHTSYTSTVYMSLLISYDLKHGQCGSSHLTWNLQAIMSSYVVIVSRPAAIILETQEKSASMEFNLGAGNFKSEQACASNGALPLSLSAS
jgi:hypothetical protein